MIDYENQRLPRIYSLADAVASTTSVHTVSSFLDPDRSFEKPSFKFTFHVHEIFVFHDVIEPIEGRILPTCDDMERWIRLVQKTIDHRSTLLIHCHMGLSRSVAAAAVAAYMLDAIPIADIPGWLRRDRPNAWPNSLMLSYADKILGASGKLSEIGVATRLATLRERPEWVETLRGTHRRREVDEVMSLLT
ncbi:hypothetical protein QA649_04295 [Bradyrhizobium sp. CB1717]|uniref:hypothetical protein n=1 Tax=Bradyrhizobium sp. CB1717 TaxID=3039154 RepID=UPI0024B26136|nr:hypothetical protein [Bradyrhizobium sp. CB1717]WFU25471.1 hypothetical protein QA649_04295 [Bradyrhizobium sp. CB1717]